MSTNTGELAQLLKKKLDYEELTNCMRCGFCQPACPTFGETGLEAASPRGRIALMKAVADGLMEPDQAFKDQLDLCLGCRACEPVCPSNVKYGHLLEQARESIETHASHSLPVKLLRRTVFKGLFPHQNRMRMLGGLLKLYQRTGLRRVVRGVGIMKLFPAHMRQMERILPDADNRGIVNRIGTFVPAKGDAIGTVGLFRGCIMDVLFTDTNENTVKLLTEAGYNVAIPDAQVCCGALHAHSGENETAKSLARTNIRVFRELQVDYVVSNAGGCGALLVEYDHLLHEEPEWKEASVWFAKRVKDISELLLMSERVKNEWELSAGGTIDNATITYQDSCHLRNVMRSASAPRQLIRQAAGSCYRELPEADKCCGSAGIYNLLQPDMSTQILDHKMEKVKGTGATVVLTSNPGCLLQMKLGIEREGLSGQVEALHVVDYLAKRLPASRGK